MNLWRRICAAGVLTLVTMLLMAASASADSYCPTGYACFWTDTLYRGDKKTIPASQAGNGWINLTGIFNDNIESGKNRFTNRFIYLAAGWNGTDGWAGFAPGDECNNFNDDSDDDCHGIANNWTSSFMVPN